MKPDDAALLQAIFHHLVLPSKVPQQYDGDDDAIAQDLGQRLQDAFTLFRNVGPSEIWDILESSLQTIRVLNGEYLDKNDLSQAFENLLGCKSTVWLAIHVVQQNAALLVYRDPV